MREQKDEIYGKKNRYYDWRVWQLLLTDACFSGIVQWCVHTHVQFGTSLSVFAINIRTRSSGCSKLFSALLLLWMINFCFLFCVPEGNP